MTRLRSKPALQHARGRRPAALLGVELHARQPAAADRRVGTSRPSTRSSAATTRGRPGADGVGVREVADRRQGGASGRRRRTTSFQPMCGSLRGPVDRARPCRAAARGRRRRPRRFARTAAACPGRRRAAARAAARQRAGRCRGAASAASPAPAAPTPGSTSRSAPRHPAASAGHARPRRPAARTRRAASAGCRRRGRSASTVLTSRPSCWAARPPAGVGRARPARSASASALNAASTTWWSSPPRPCRWIAIRPRRESESKKWGTRRPGARRPARPRRRQVDAARTPRPPRSTVAWHERLVERRPGVAVAADAGAVAERRVERLAERDRDVLDGVVRVDPQVARADCRSRSISEWKASAVSMWSRKPMPVVTAAVPAPSSAQRAVDLSSRASPLRTVPVRAGRVPGPSARSGARAPPARGRCRPARRA